MERGRCTHQSDAQLPSVFEALQHIDGGFDPALLTLICGLIDYGVIHFGEESEQIPARIIA